MINNVRITPISFLIALPLASLIGFGIYKFQNRPPADYDSMIAGTLRRTQQYRKLHGVWPQFMMNIGDNYPDLLTATRYGFKWSYHELSGNRLEIRFTSDQPADYLQIRVISPSG